MFILKVFTGAREALPVPTVLTNVESEHPMPRGNRGLELLKLLTLIIIGEP